jgi:hypothetical protein
MRGSIIFKVVTDGAATWRSQAIMYEAEKFIEFNIFVTDELFLESRSAWVAELSARFNDAVPAGCWIYRYDEQDVRFRVVRTFRNEAEITADAIAHLLETVAFPLKLWERAFSYRYDEDVAPQDALEISLIALEAFDGDGLPNVVMRAVLSVSGASGLNAMPVEHANTPMPSSLKLV